MKKLIITLSIAFALTACTKKESGVCYCKFVKGAPQEYDLRSYDRSEQIDKCYTHDNNAAKFGGGCKLE